MSDEKDKKSSLWSKVKKVLIVVGTAIGSALLFVFIGKRHGGNSSGAMESAKKSCEDSGRTIDDLEKSVKSTEATVDVLKHDVDGVSKGVESVSEGLKESVDKSGSISERLDKTESDIGKCKDISNDIGNKLGSATGTVSKLEAGQREIEDIIKQVDDSNGIK